MISNSYIHPALTSDSINRKIVVIVESITLKSRRIRIISASNENERLFIFVPNKIYQLEVNVGDCFEIIGEDRFTKYYGDIFIADCMNLRKPTINVFLLFCFYRFPLINRTTLKKIIIHDQINFIRAVFNNDLAFFTSECGLPKSIAVELLAFCYEHLEE